MHPAAEQCRQTAAFLAEALPDAYGILLFDLTQEGFPLEAKYHFKYTNAQKYVEPFRGYLRQILKSEAVVHNGMLTCRGDVAIENKMFKTSFLITKDEAEAPVCCLVLYMEVSELLPVYRYVEQLFSFRSEEIAEITPREPEQEEELTLDVIDRETERFTDAPERMTPDERMELLLDLYDTGVFELKGAVSRAAFVLGMSEPSVYRYLAKIRRARGE